MGYSKTFFIPEAKGFKKMENKSTLLKKKKKNLFVIPLWCTAPVS